MSKLTELYNRTKAKQEPRRNDIATKAERDRLIGDRRKYPPVPAHDHPAPDWAVNPGNLHRQRMRKSEQRINDLNKRLGRASVKLDRDFDRSR